MAHSRQRKPRAAILTSVHPPMDVRVFHREARSLAAHGLDIVLIAPGAPRGAVDGVRFQSLPLWGGRLGRPLRWPVLFWRALHSRASIYHFHDPELLPWGLLLRLVTRKPVIYDSHEYFVESILDKQWIPAPMRRPTAWLARRVERFAAKRLSAVIAVTEDMAEGFREVQAKTVLVRNMVAVPDIPYPPERRLPVVIYAGLMDMSRGLSILWETARLLRTQCPQAEIHILGPVDWYGAPDEDRHRSSNDWAAVGVRFLGTVPASEVAAILGEAWLGWLPLDPKVRNSALAWPTKLAEYMLMGLPVVASDLPIPTQTIKSEDCGAVVAGLDAKAHAEAMAKMFVDEKTAREQGERGRLAALAKYTWPQESEKLQALYDDLLGTARVSLTA